LVIINRTQEAAADLARAVGCRYAPIGQLTQELRDTQVLINATSVGMAPNANQSLVSKELLSPECVVMDLVSNPKETLLLKAGQEVGCRVVYGERMLLWQGVLKFQLYTGIEPPVEVMERALQKGM
jgi:shikimate dehydrogenase